jgi:hypothetical protein
MCLLGSGCLLVAVLLLEIHCVMNMLTCCCAMFVLTYVFYADGPGIGLMNILSCALWTHTLWTYYLAI